MFKGSFDEKVSKLLIDLAQEANALKVERINSTMLLKALLEAEESPLYNAILSQVEDITFFPDMVEETYDYIPVEVIQETGNEENAKKIETEREDGENYRITLKDNSDEITTIFFSKDLMEFLGLVEDCLSIGETVDIRKFTELFLYKIPCDVIKIFRTFGVRTELLKKYFTVNAESSADATTVDATQPFEIPQELKSFVRNLNEELKGESCDISQRDRECKLVWQTLMKKTKRNVALIGEPGVGKTSIVVKMVHDILNETCPAEFKGFTVLALDVTSSVAGTMYRGQAEERFSALVDYLNNQPNIILFIDEMHLINGAGACREGEIDLANTLKPILSGGKVRVIGATTNDEYEKYFSRDGALKRRFRPVYVKEPKMKEVYPMLKKSIETLSNYHGISITEEMVGFIILNAACFHNETCNPDRTKDLIDLSMVVAKQAGKTEVDRESVLANFSYHFKKFAKMSDRTKRSTAYHEAGHCLVALCSKELNNYDVVAVSIMPSDSYLGVTVFEKNDVTPEYTMEYYIDSIAMNLAGRVSEKMFTRTITSGAYVDLQMATQQAHSLVSRYGMVEFGKNRNYTEETTNDKVKDRINEEIDKIIEQAMQRAKDILCVNHDALNLLVEALMKNGIVGPNDLKQILTNIEKI
ncbi:MAG: AAA family ATPase [Clostridia bacterium]